MTTTSAAPMASRLEADAPDSATGVSWLTLAGIASLGAGAVHAAAAGAHGEHPQAVWVFTALAVAQVLWGVAALVRRDRTVALLGVAVGLAAVSGWVLAKSYGLPFVAGLDVPEPVQFADLSAAMLAALATVGSVWAATAGGALVVIRVPMWLTVAAVTAFASGGTVATSGHDHAGGQHLATAHGAAHAHATVPYDPALPIDLSGTPGVTPKEQAAAESLVAVTLARLPRWSDAKVAERAGFRSIGDGFTGTEHLINRAFLRDGTTLDPDRPESLVYDTTGGGRRLVAAMYMLAPGTPLSAVPDVGGALVQWHIHDNLCFSASGFVQGITTAGRCANGLLKPVPAPMVHVWITKNPCGPFAALEGIAGGSIAPGQTRLCDHAHGSKA
jgi:hypothetical protein